MDVIVYVCPMCFHLGVLEGVKNGDSKDSVIECLKCGSEDVDWVQGEAEKIAAYARVVVEDIEAMQTRRATAHTHHTPELGEFTKAIATTIEFAVTKGVDRVIRILENGRSRKEDR